MQRFLKLLNIAGNQIDPATEQGLIAILSELTDMLSTMIDGSQIVRNYDGYGNPLSSKDGSINVHNAHIHSDGINHFCYYKPGGSTALNGGLTAGDRLVTVVSAAGFSVDGYIDIKDGTTHIHHWRKIIAINASVITVDAGVDQDFSSGSTVDYGIANMAVDGSTTPVIFTVTPKIGQTLHIVRCMPTLEHPTAADDSRFGGIGALTNGVVLRINHNGGESYTTRSTWRTNKDMKEDMYDVTYSDKAGGGNYATNGRWTFSNDGFIGKVLPTDVLEVVIQDNLSVLIDFQIKFKGHPE